MSADERDDSRTKDPDFSALWSSDGVTRSFSPTATGVPADLPFLFGPGQRFGGYAIVRPLGKGGMGQVYEAEEIDSGRRVALKLLSRGLGDDEERERFLREGRLAASLSHPNCVYVFGTSEIQGFPIIAMELVPEGTLKDRVVPGSPMTASAAVDAILQVIDGLEAAASIGILHRDIKPSNCFVHRDGRVLVGDFGLSVAAVRGEGQATASRQILGTPGFASPEQLRGEPLDVRSDIYAVGATIFYLLSGRAPFDDRTTTSLIAKVTQEPPPLLTDLRPELPRGLAAIVARCLAKTPGERFANYAALRAALEPYGTSRSIPAPIIRRTLAGMLDAWLLGLLTLPVNMLLRLQPLNASHRADGWIVAASAAFFAIVYYGLLEGLLGTSAGKALFGLRVADEHQVTPGVRRAAARAAIFQGPTQIAQQVAAWVLLQFVPDISVGFVTTVTGLAGLAVLFSTARRRNGCLALHDRFTRTRVVRRTVRADALGRRRASAAEAVKPIDGPNRIGPYIVPPSIATEVSQPIRLEAFDDRLQRRVWIQLLPPGSPPVAATRRDLGRRTRLRWLGGRRETAECWDAYEVVDGMPLAAAVSSPLPWTLVRHWLLDLTQETVAGLEDGTLPDLHPDRVWIGRDDHARLLDWPGDNAAAGGPAPDLPSVQRFLYGAAVSALTGAPFERAVTLTPETPLPLGVRTLLLSLRDATFTSARELLDAASGVLAAPAAFPKTRRAIQIGVSAAVPIAITVVAIGSIFMLSRSKMGDRALFTMDACLNELERTERTLRKGPNPEALQKQNDVQIYLAEHFGDRIRSEDTWARSMPNLGARGGRARAQRALDAHPVRTPEEVRRADATVAALLDDQGEGLERFTSPRALTATTVAILAWMFTMPAAFAGLGALAAGSGFTFRPMGVALVNRRGQRISRIRALLRAFVTWSPVIALVVLLKYGPRFNDVGGWRLTLEIAMLAGFAIGAAWAIVRPSRAIQDRIAGTWIVPR